MGQAGEMKIKSTKFDFVLQRSGIERDVTSFELASEKGSADNLIWWIGPI